jgi:hypothetical protein
MGQEEKRIIRIYDINSSGYRYGARYKYLPTVRKSIQRWNYSEFEVHNHQIRRVAAKNSISGS